MSSSIPNRPNFIPWAFKHLSKFWSCKSPSAAPAVRFTFAASATVVLKLLQIVQPQRVYSAKRTLNRRGSSCKWSAISMCRWKWSSAPSCANPTAWR